MCPGAVFNSAKREKHLRSRKQYRKDYHSKLYRNVWDIHAPEKLEQASDIVVARIPVTDSKLHQL